MPFFIPERDVVISFGLSENNLIIHSISLTLNGFQLYVNTDWLNSRDRLVKTIVVYTGNEEDSIVVCSVDLKAQPAMNHPNSGHAPSTVTTPVEDSILNQFLKEYQQDSFSLKELDEGNIFTGTPKQFTTSTSTFYQIPKGDYVASTGLIFLNFNLKKLGFGERSGSLLKEPSDMQIERVCNYFKIKLSNSSSTSASSSNYSSKIQFSRLLHKLCIIIQQSLVFLNCLPLVFPIDGFLCAFTSEALDIFKTQLMGYEESSLNYEDHSSSSPSNDTTICSKEVLQSMISQIMNLKAKLDQLGYTLQHDPFSYPDKLCRRIKQFQKSNHLQITKVFDAETIQELMKSKTVEKKSLLIQPVAAVSSTVSNMKNKVEEFAGLRYDGHLLERENPSYESLDVRLMDLVDVGYHLKSLMKKDDEIAEKEEKKRKKTLKKDKKISLIESTFEDGISIPSRMLKGIKLSTTKTLGGIALKGKSMTKNMTLGVKHLMQGGSSSSESDLSAGEYDRFDADQQDEDLSHKQRKQAPKYASVDSKKLRNLSLTCPYSGSAVNAKISRDESALQFDTMGSNGGSGDVATSPSSSNALPNVESLMVIPTFSGVDLGTGNEYEAKPFPFAPNTNRDGTINENNPYPPSMQRHYSNPIFVSTQKALASNPNLNQDSLASPMSLPSAIGSSANPYLGSHHQINTDVSPTGESFFSNLTTTSANHPRPSIVQNQISPTNRTTVDSLHGSPLMSSKAPSMILNDPHNMPNEHPDDPSEHPSQDGTGSKGILTTSSIPIAKQNPYLVHESVVNIAASLIKKMNSLDSFIHQMTEVNEKFDVTLNGFSERTNSIKLESEELMRKLDVLQHEQKQLGSYLDTIIKNENLKAKYGLDLLKEKTREFDELVLGSLGRVKRIESKMISNTANS